ncbi:MAG TPA: NADH-quinone oxidoreductase subunit NuoK [Bacilli bacterium]|nr:NADH-quinone oxidoreductase subunit NuoK [Bacilli bacterium]
MSSIPLSVYLIVALLLFSIGMFGVLAKRNAVLVLISIELMLNAVNINLVAFAMHGVNPGITGQVFSLFTITIAAAEAAVGLAILIALYRNRKTVNIDQMDLMKR